MRHRATVLLLAGSLALAAACQQSDSRLGAYAPTGKPTVTIAGVELFVRPEAARFAAAHQVNLTDVLDPVVRRTTQVLHSPRTSIVIQMKARLAIYEVGVGGSTHPTRGSIVISLADELDEQKDEQALTTWLPQTVAHEMNHSARILDGPGYGTSLRDTMISEGLADQFAKAVVPGSPVAPWTDALTPAQAVELWKRAQPVLDRRNRATNRTWLFGSDDVPRWTAYTLGSRIVAAHRERRPRESWYDLTREASKKILQESGYTSGA